MNSQTNTLHLFGRPLPDSIINLIFEFDHTKREAFDRCMNQFSKGCYDRRVPAKHYIKSKYNYWSRGQYQDGRTHFRVPEYDENFDEERMARWVDNLYKRQFANREEVHMDGRYIKSTTVSGPLPVVVNFRELRRALWPAIRAETWKFDPEFKIAPGDDRWTRDVYMYTYHANKRDWRGIIGQGWRAKRVEKGLPIYADKARYNMYVCDNTNIKLVSKILKNIKKWERRNPELCNY